MDFGTILDEWEKRSEKKPVLDKDKEVTLKETKENKKDRRSRLLKKRPDAVIDLHGLTQDEAWVSLDNFFNNSIKMGFEKVQIIHGKGDPPNNEAVLRLLSRRFIENCHFAGESAYCSAKEGGSGATWVIIKNYLSR